MQTRRDSDRCFKIYQLLWGESSIYKNKGSKLPARNSEELRAAKPERAANYIASDSIPYEFTVERKDKADKRSFR